VLTNRQRDGDDPMGLVKVMVNIVSCRAAHCLQCHCIELDRGGENTQVVLTAGIFDLWGADVKKMTSGPLGAFELFIQARRDRCKVSFKYAEFFGYISLMETSNFIVTLEDAQE
jgi:hypothetical protein